MYYKAVERLRMSREVTHPICKRNNTKEQVSRPKRCILTLGNSFYISNRAELRLERHCLVLTKALCLPDLKPQRRNLSRRYAHCETKISPSSILHIKRIASEKLLQRKSRHTVTCFLTGKKMIPPFYVEDYTGGVARFLTSTRIFVMLVQRKLVWQHCYKDSMLAFQDELLLC